MESARKIKGLKRFLINLREQAKDKQEEEQQQLAAHATSGQNPVLRYGNVLFMQFETEVGDSNGTTRPFEGILSGDGLALDDITVRSNSTLNKTTMERFLFRIDPPRLTQKERRLRKQRENARAKREKEKIQQRLKEEEARLKNNKGKDNDNEQDDNDSEEENEDDDEEQHQDFEKKRVANGDPVLYGSELRLFHLYSKGYVTIDPFKLSKEEECVKTKLTTEDSNYGRVKLFDPSHTKRPGEAVLSKDTVGISFVFASGFFLKVHEGSYLNDAMKVNAGKEESMFKVMYFAPFGRSRDKKDGTLKNGHVIRLFNRDVEMYLGVKYDPVNYKIVDQKIKNIGGDTEKLMSSNYQYPYFHREKVDDSKVSLEEENKEDEEDKDKDLEDDKEDVSLVQAQNEKENDVSTLWEVRISKCLKNDGIPNSTKTEKIVMLKNVLTGQFLYYDPDSQMLKLKNLNEKGAQPKRFGFFMKMKNNWGADNSVKYNNLITIKDRQSKNKISFYENGPEDYEIRVSNAQKGHYPFFMVESCGKENRIASKIKDSNKLINKFYMFLQNFGREKAKQGQKRSNVRKYALCVEQEARLDFRVDQMLLCMDSLISVFTEDIINTRVSSWNASDYIQRINTSFQGGKLESSQKRLSENFIVQNLLGLYKLILHMIYVGLFGLKEMKKKRNYRVLSQVLERKDEILQAKLLPVFLKDYLDPLVEKMLIIFYLVEYNNANTSLGILNNFPDFYYPLNFYRTNLTRILTESTSNSELMGKRCRVAFKIILEDMILPKVGRSQIKYQTFKLKLLKHLLENMRSARHDGDAQSFSYFLRKWKEKVEKLYFFRFENLNNDPKNPVLKFYVASQSFTRDQEMTEKLEDLRQNTFKYMRKAIIQSNVEGDYTTFLFRLSDISAPNRSSFKKYIQYYIDTKTMMWISSYEFKVELKGVEGLELDMQRGMLMNLCLNDGLAWRIKKSISDFVTDVYLNVEKYNYFTDIHDFSFFLQRIKSLKVNEIFSMRPVVFMNKEALQGATEIEPQAMEESDDEEDKSDVSFEEPPPVPIDLDSKEYFPLLHCEDFFAILLHKLAQIVLDIPSPAQVTSSKERVTKFLHKMKELTFLSKIAAQFMEIGFCKFDELKFILTILNNLLHNTKQILFGNRMEILGLAASKGRNRKNVNPAKNFKVSAKLLMTFTDILASVNTYRSNLVMLVTIKFFNEMTLRGQFSEELTDRFLKDQVGYLEVLGFENNTETLDRALVTVEQMTQLKAMIASKMQNASESKKSVSKLDQMLTTLNWKMNDLRIEQKTNLASDLMDILILSINPAREKKQEKDGGSVRNTLMHFDDVYYIKILKKKVLGVLEGYYSRGIRVLNQLVDFEYVFEDRSMMRVVDRLEVTPEEMADFNEAIKADYTTVLNKDNEFMKKIGALRSELQRHFESRVYFPKIQKLSQISKWSEPCATILVELAESLKQRKEKIKNGVNPSNKGVAKVSQKSSNKSKRKDTDNRTDTESSVVNRHEATEQERRIFYTIRDFFVLQMSNSEIQVLEEQEDIRYLFLDVFMEWGLPCEEVLVELYHYLPEEEVIQDIKLLFEYIDENNIMESFDQNKEQDIDLLIEAQSDLLLKCSKLDQYFNILRSFTNSSDVKQRAEYQTQILTNLLQSSLFSTLLDSGFMSTYVENVSKNLGLVGFAPRNPRVNLVETLRDLSQKEKERIRQDPIEFRKFCFERLARVVTNMMDNALNLAADCLWNNTFSQLIFKSESDYNDIITIIKNVHTPLYLKIPYYRLIFDGYFRCEEPQYKKIINIFNLLINKDLFEVIQFFESQIQAKSGRLFNNIAKYTKLRLKKNNGKFKKSEKEGKSKEKEEVEEDHEEDDESESENDSEINDGEEDSDFSEDEGAKEEAGQDTGQNRSGLLDDKKTHKNIWFCEREVGLFLTTKLRDGKLYGMIGAMADLTIFLVANIQMYRKNMYKTKELFSNFENLVGQVKKFMPDFKHYFGKQSYCHALNLIGVLEVNTGILLIESQDKKLTIMDYNETTRTDLKKKMERLGGSGGDMSSIKRMKSRDSGETDPKRNSDIRYGHDIEGVNLISQMGKKGYGHQDEVINSIIHNQHQEDTFAENSPKNQLKLMMARFQPGCKTSVVSNRTNDIPSVLMSPGHEVMPISGFKPLVLDRGSNFAIRDQGLNNVRSRFKKMLELLRFSLASLRLSFELQMENLLDDGFKDLEDKLVKMLVTLVLEAIKTKYNFLLSFQAKYDLKVDLSTMKWFVRQVRQRVFDEGEDILLDAADSFQNVRMDDYEVLLVCIKLQSLLYGESRWAGEILYHQEHSVGELPSSSSNISPTGAGGNPKTKKKRYPINVIQPHRKCLRKNFLDIIARKSMKGKSLKKFISNANMFRFLLEAIEMNVFGLQRFILQANHYVKIISHELYGFHISDFYRIFKRKKLEKCLSSKKHRFLFVHSLKHASIQGLAVLNPGREPKTAKKIQSELSSRFVGLFSLRLICSEKESLTVKAEAMELLYYLLLNGNEKIQKEFYQTIMENYEFLNIIECIESILKSCHKRILKGLKRIQREKNKGQFKDSSDSIFQRFSKINAYQMMGLTFKLLQVFTENCYSDFQNLFREQVFEDHRRNNNLIQLVIDIIISLGKYIIFDKKRASHDEEERPGSDGTSSLGSETEEETNTKVDVVENQKDARVLKVFQTKGVVAAIKNVAKNGRSKYRHTEEVAVSMAENQRIKELIHLGFHFVNDCMMGPNETNQKLINSNVGMINFCCSIIRRIRFQEDKNLSCCLLGERDESDFTLFADSVKLLLYATNGNIGLVHLGNIFNRPNMEMLRNKAKDIYEKVIQFNRNLLYSWKTCCLIEADDFEIEKKDLMMEPLKGVKKKKKKKRAKTPGEEEILSQREQLQKSIQKGNEFLLKMNLKKKKRKKKVVDSNPKGCMPWECHESGSKINKLYIGVIEAGHNLFILMKKYEYLSKKEFERGYTDYYDFYNKFYGHVEVATKNKIQIARYTKPYHCHFHYDKETVVTDFEIEPYAEKIKNFMSRIKMYEAILLTRQNLYRSYKPMYYFIKYKDRIAFLFYLVLLIINGMLIIYVKHSIDGNFSIQGLDLRQGYSYFQNHLGPMDKMVFYLGTVNVFLAFLLFVVNLFDNQRHIYHLKKQRNSRKKELNSIRKKQKFIRKVILQAQLWSTQGFMLHVQSMFSGINIYNVIILGVSILAMKISMIYPFLLLDLVQRSITLKNIIQSISFNWKQLMSTMILTLIIMFIYSTISFTYFPDHFKHGSGSQWMNYCHSLSTCFITVVNNGLRAGGGLGDALGQPSLEDTRFALRYWVDFTFYILILIILLNIVFGIIIDTFGDMRNARNEWRDYLNTTCMICDLKKTEIDSAGEGYFRHINVSHSIEDYIYFMIYVKKKNLNNCDGLEQYVKSLHASKNYAFMPNQESFHCQADDTFK